MFLLQRECEFKNGESVHPIHCAGETHVRLTAVERRAAAIATAILMRGKRCPDSQRDASLEELEAI